MISEKEIHRQAIARLQPLKEQKSRTDITYTSRYLVRIFSPIKARGAGLDFLRQKWRRSTSTCVGYGSYSYNGSAPADPLDAV
jgi:hypothetical protein